MIAYRPGYYGWLGNQMFQYAATKALAIHLGVGATFPHNNPDLHKVFHLSAGAAAIKPPYYLLEEPHFHYWPGFWNLEDGAQLSGYFQSEKYFAPYADQIRKEFTFRVPTEWMHVPDWVGVHVRRGDYLTFPLHHPPCSLDYYHRAMESFPGAFFLVFAAPCDQAWARENLDGPRVQIRSPKSAAEDMRDLSLLPHQIIANSSFSWWAAWLNANPGKRIIAPRIWFGPAKAGWDTKDLLPEMWEVM